MSTLNIHVYFHDDKKTNYVDTTSYLELWKSTRQRANIRMNIFPTIRLIVGDYGVLTDSRH